MNIKADPADEIDDNKVPQPGAEHGEGEDDQTQGDQAEARTDAEGEQPEATVDDPVAENDPLVLARKGPPKKDAKPAKAAEAEEAAPAEDDETVDPPADEPPKKPEAKAKTKPAPIDDDPSLSAKLPDEDWQKLSHKGKSLFLQAQKVGRAKSAEISKAREEASRYKADYDQVEAFVAQQGLAPEAYRNSMVIAGLAARGDVRALPALEETVAQLRKLHGKADPAPAAPPAPPAPVVNADELLSAIHEAQTSMDYSKVEALAKKLKDSQAAPPVAPPAPPAAPAAPPQVQPAGNEAQAANRAIADFLVESGIQPERLESYIGGLIKADPALAKVPPAERLRAVMKAHKAAVAKATPPKPQPQAISGRGRTAGGGRTSTTIKDPLLLARTPGTPESRGGR